MAIISEEPQSPPQLRHRKSNPKPTPEPEPEPEPKPVSPPTKSAETAAVNPFSFWFYFTLSVSLITLTCLLVSSLSPQDPKSWFLKLPPILRRHYSNGRTLKVQTALNHPQVEVFSIQQGPLNADSRVLIVHGAGSSSFSFQHVVKSLGTRNVRAVAIDLPGSGFSDKSVVVMEESVGGSDPFSKMWDVYEDIREKGIFWGFDQLVEQGYVNLEEKEVRVSKRERVKPIELGSEEMGRVLGQVVDSMELAPVDLVLHDSALGLSANWISENRGLIRSVVVLDGAPSGMALPLWVVGVPVVREIVLGFRFVFEMVLGKCCVKSVVAAEAEAHRILLKGRGGASAVVGMGKKLNCSFDLSEWSSRDGVKGLPFQVIWSGGWSDEWTSEGRQTADALLQAKFVTHSGGRWMQEHNSEEVAESIYEFVSSLPKSPRKAVEDTIPDRSEEKHTATNDDQHHHGHGHEHGHHGHGHAGFMDSYGMGHGYGM
ncbi:protein AUXIN RESPONSE 4 [Salvia miltiorrhiza]|uniref:protein AUXIN RESPONSE 4 n=1 Tax=Salvia miltiorrhiza TaxID=226208 RepID=UPI0025ACE211|nr:protein AUXIN RESPONSE 4 [Salvia miltiorrhiza]